MSLYPLSLTPCAHVSILARTCRAFSPDFHPAPIMHSVPMSSRSFHALSPDFSPLLSRSLLQFHPAPVFWAVCLGLCSDSILLYFRPICLGVRFNSILLLYSEIAEPVSVGLGARRGFVFRQRAAAVARFSTAARVPWIHSTIDRTAIRRRGGELSRGPDQRDHRTDKQHAGQGVGRPGEQQLGVRSCGNAHKTK